MPEGAAPDHACRVLISGIPTRADHLLLQCEPAIREFLPKDRPSDTDLDSDRLLQNLRQTTKLVRREYVNNWVATALNMEFDDFRKHSRAEFHESHYHEVWDTIKHFDLGAELIITLFDVEGIPVSGKPNGRKRTGMECSVRSLFDSVSICTHSSLQYLFSG